MGDFMLLFPSKYLSAPDLGGKDTTVVISAVRREELDVTDEVDGKMVEKKEAKGIVSFKGLAKDLVLTKAVGHALAMMFGNETKGWAEKSVTLHTPSERWFGEDKPRIRVKGSPLIKEPMEKRIKLGRKKYTIKLVPTT